MSGILIPRATAELMESEKWQREEAEAKRRRELQLIELKYYLKGACEAEGGHERVRQFCQALIWKSGGPLRVYPDLTLAEAAMLVSDVLLGEGQSYKEPT